MITVRNRIKLIVVAMCAIAVFSSHAVPPKSEASGATAAMPIFDVPTVPPEFATLRKSAETQSIRLSVEMARVVLLQDPIPAKFELFNGRSEFVHCDHSEDSADFSISLFDYQGHEVPLTEYGKLHDIDPYTFTFNQGLRLQPGQRITRQYDLTKYFRISAPGPYRMHVIKAIAWTPSFKRPGKDLEVQIDSVIFNVRKGNETLKK